MGFEMYKFVKTSRENALAFSVASDDKIFCDITDDEKTAAEFVALLNENDVEEIHIFDVIEDYFYG
jgi:hypothetical protein